MEQRRRTEREILMELGFTMRDETTLDGMAEKVISSLNKLDKELVVVCRVTGDGQYFEIIRSSGDFDFLGKLNPLLRELGFPEFSFEKWKVPAAEPENIFSRICGERVMLVSDNVIFPSVVPENIVTARMTEVITDFIPRNHELYRALNHIKPPTVLRLAGYDSIICTPFYNGDDVAGAISMIGASGDPPLTGDDVDIIRSVAGILSVHYTNVSRREALEASEARWTALVEHAYEGIALCRDGWIRLANGRFTELTGLTPPCALESFLELFTGDDRAACAEIMTQKAEPRGEMKVKLEAKSDPGSSVSGEGRASKSSGEFSASLEESAGNRERVVRISYSFFPYKGSPALLLFLRDITRERKLKSDLAEQERIASLGVVAAGLSHELNNPLAAILTHVELLRRRGEKTEETENFFDVISRNVAKMKKILTDMSRFAEERLPRPITVSLRTILEECLDEMSEYFRENGVELTKDFADFEDAVEADSRLLRQAVSNLVANAVTASEGEPKKITVTCEPSPDDCGRAVIHVRDYGVGIPAEIRSRVFEPFFTSWKDARGSGLGLAIVKKIVRTHGGTIGFQNAPGGGTVFTVTLPLRAKSAPANEEK